MNLKLNIKTIIISDDKEGPAQNYSDQFIFAKYDDKDKLQEFINQVDVVTYEFENIPIDILRNIDKEKKQHIYTHISKLTIFYF